ncbi:MAG: glycyl-radical enzyme activating protein [Elusimicrobia bacterium]|nr:glycyl-radical enzyme activating protein [Elusimicrobiota bacterium]
MRSLVFLKGCPLSCAWCCNPESQQARPELMRRPGLCVACGRCAAASPDLAAVEACPSGALGLVGREVAAEELLDEIERDRDFYRNSGGGVTFSGGEPFSQAVFLGELLAGCRGRGIHCAVETCGQAQPGTLAALEPAVDLFLFDLKVLDPERHRRLTGQDNRLILDNFRFLAGLCPGRLVPRLTVVPGISDTPENLSALAGLLHELKLGRIELIPYHPLGLGKWEGLGRAPACLPDADPLGGRTEAAARTFAQQGLACSVP